VTRRSREPDGVLLSVGWGALWASALGTWLIAPTVLKTHHFHPRNAAGWLALTIGLPLLFGLGGMFLGFIGGFAPVIVESLRGRFSDRLWAYGFFMGPILVIEWIVECLLIHRTAFGSLTRLIGYRRDLAITTVGLSLSVLLLTWVYRRFVIPAQPRGRVLVWTLCGATIAGIGALIPTLGASPAPVTVTLERTSAAADTPLLFIGLDGGTWRVLQPAMADGSAPTFKRLVDSGTYGTVDALWPPYWSSAAWASILTGLPQDVTGVYEDLAGQGAGLASFQIPLSPTLRLLPFFVLRAMLLEAGVVRFTPPPRNLLNGKPVWQLLQEQGVDTAVMRFRFTYPPEGQTHIAVSDWAGRDEWEALGVRREMGPDTVTPRARADELLAPFRQEAVLNPQLLGTLLPGAPAAAPTAGVLDPVQALRTAADIDERTFVASESILRGNPKQPFLAVYVGGLDAVEHAFWPYRFPADFDTDRPTAEEVARLGPVIDRYVHYVDDRLNRLLSSYKVPPNVVIVADHGHGATMFQTAWRGWHTREGVFLAAGPGIAHRSDPIAVSYYDIVPTLVGLKGFRVTAGITGHSVVVAPDSH
jgi:predicted AlkP superfamily phosphohydrolase/phosphomutase